MGSKPLVRPPRLARGSRVALVAPAGPLLDRDDLTRAEALCRALDYEPLLAPHAGARYGYLGGTDEQRLADLNAALRDPAVDAVWCIRGGYGLTRILGGVDFPALVRRPKAVIGFSDVTALLAGVTRCAGVVGFHGPNARTSMPGFSRRHFERVLSCAAPAGPLEPLPQPAGVLVARENRIVTLQGGVAEGRLAGGNLSLLQCLIGTGFFPDLDGALLVLEDVGEDLYRVDRMLSHLRMAGALDRLAGVLVGRFSELQRGTGDGALGFDEVLATYFGPLRIPVALGFPVGHIDDQWTLPLGIQARLDADTGEVSLLEPAVA
ncbi:MAG TPA: LD-carboxypeptidase [Gemmatimonadales bacterium]|jgi:muramoyltetrapeptide carboxypeptidase|nr:LD-carboxypeptidase [Gemmatimonadales bacterium]